MAIQNLTRLYEGSALSGANDAVIFVPVEFDCAINRIKVKLESNAVGDIVFCLTETNGAVIAGTTLAIAAGTSEEILDGLTIERLEDADFNLKMISGAFASTLTLSLKVDDGETGGGLTEDAADARYVQTSTLVETIQDTVGAMLTPGAHALINYNDAAGMISIDSVQLTDEEIQDKVAAFLAGGANTTVTYNDAGNVLTIGETTAGLTTEQIQDMLATFLAGGANVTLTYDDGGNSLTVAATTSGGGTVTDATISTSDITTNNVSTSKHGFAPKLPNDATKFLDGTGAYSVPPGGGTSELSGLFAAPKTTQAENDEFEGASLNAKWAKTSTGVLIENYNDRFRSALQVKVSNVGDYNLIQTYAPGSADFSTTLCFNWDLLENYNQIYLSALDAANNNSITAGLVYNTSTRAIFAQKKVSGAVTYDIIAQATITDASFPQMLIHLQRTGGTWNVWYSSNGVNWNPFLSAYANAFTVGKISIGLSSTNNATAAKKPQAVFHWFRRDWITL